MVRVGAEEDAIAIATADVAGVRHTHRLLNTHPNRTNSVSGAGIVNVM